MTTNRNPTKTLYALLLLGLALGGAALAPTAAALCTGGPVWVPDGDGGYAAVAVIVIGGADCKAYGHDSPYVEVLGQTILP